MTALVVVVDGGGSSCRLGVFNHTGACLARTEIKQHASLTLGVESAWAHIQQGIQCLANRLDLAPGWFPDRLILGLAGALQERHRAHLLSLIPAATSTSVITDGKAQLLGATGDGPGICLAVGTGSVVHWQDAMGRSDMAGGWGFPLGDQGSGAWLGLQLLQQYLWWRDGAGYSSTLWSSVEESVGNSVSAIQLWAGSANSSKYATLAPLIFAHAKQGDKVAQTLLQKGVDQCRQLVALAPAELPLVVVGGIGEKLVPALQEYYAHRLRKPEGDALHGLWLFASRATS